MTSGYELRAARTEDVPGARAVMLDTFYREFTYGYRPHWHADVIDIEGAYLRPPRHALFVAAKDDKIVATTGIRAAAPNSPPHPAWLADQYPTASTAQLFRVYVSAAHRRHGLARALVQLACEFVATTPGYQAIYLHTDTRVPGAEPFWRSLAKEIHDDRATNPGCVHFEIPIPPGT
jgi:GNAT superfamily N-acetyltransferase